MNVLVCGGAGYIGSHMAAYLLENGHNVVIVDNLTTGHKESILNNKLYVGDLRDEDFLNKVFDENKIDAVIDFAANSLVGESVANPLKYFDNNIQSVVKLLEAMKNHDVKYIVFSSTAATYGEPDNIPILEGDKTFPTNPYGESKLAVEKILKWCDNAYGIKYTALRYFNACGAHISGNIGEDHNPETHLIPLILQVALGKRDKIMIYGDDYDTEDGTCVRDYVHVSDLASAHLLALERLKNGGKSAIYNLGNGKGFSVKQVVEATRKVTGINIKAEIGERRAGDPGTLIASSDRAILELGWKPKFNSLETIIETAWKWHKNHPNGYK
ncbi:UDP-glucose 4-epimerase [Clostridium acetobutylicum]|uniref:UDP-glucose 4-epimerase n=1 Tax=Clostridium acetobutylicum (strain ATCC 824 / DSM 792 / JCM 1419 / IAM 19013 / LMG 5710 / NBRC 13948 / NRRL B-527 / VKM B-1787 / 2291 / W) TaxID=272562 RepID=Q97J57_CLOAB|nr:MULTISPECIES: UDP-glucose 4-epimerase GalE [Clostridium]AAK79397.1 UDP-glucose 4-epimerase [Clostridium acetobutylicum ATCC 824]ADZ20482.1 UDP-glucose 4-epimerase [Clostridium acetobutylicum EA 2018]AEI34351.1 UDP-glucose 4-epimerase [Clostridium acetobutylicum DSM 1731]AWV81354.1 UDP-glucose 4-epimerase GalE [Clostridium acetobutylicum]MBC2392988.1 UDP-glucose 4-epimerase GalE [Clostridium acetobutylicum]